jgi:hypothetical protein
MKLSLLLTMIGLSLALDAPAQTLGSLADIAVIDRDTGVALSPHYYRGEYWVAGRPGAKYSIEVHNRLGERLLAVTSVDGVNVLSGETAAWDQGGYVFEPGERYQISGWRKSDAEVAAFTFTASPDSYAERTGRPANVGVIGVALYRERRPQAWTPPSPWHGPVRPEAPVARDSSEANSLMSRERALSAPALGAPAFSAPQASAAAPSAGIAQSPEPAPKLGTGHGEREYSYVNHTEFARLQNQPNEVIRIRYDSLDNLLAMGVIRRGRPLPPSVDPFPGAPSPAYVPDPPG